MKKKIFYLISAGVILAIIISVFAILFQKYKQKKEDEALYQQELQEQAALKAQKKQAIEDLLYQAEQEEFNAVFLSMFPVDTVAANVLYERRGDMVAMTEQTFREKELLDTMKKVLGLHTGIDRIFLGLDMEKPEDFSVKLKENAAIGNGRTWLYSNPSFAVELVKLAKEWPEVTFEVMLSYPSMEYLQSEKTITTASLFLWYEQVGELLSQYNEVPNIHVFMPVSEEWLICNNSNYVDDYKLNAEITNRLLSHVFCDYNYIVTPANLPEKVATLADLMETYSDFDTIDLSEYTYVFFGDSVMGNYSDTTSIPNVVGCLTNANTINCGYGGLSAAQDVDKLGLADIIDGFLAEDSAVAVEKDTDKLVFFICFGINDYASGRTLKSDMLADKRTFKGAIEYAVAMLKASYPSCEVVLMTPNYISLGNYGTAAEHGVIYEDFVNAVGDLSKELQLKCIDVYRDLGIEKGNVERYLEDECHPNEYGRYQFGKLISEHLAKWYIANE